MSMFGGRRRKRASTSATTTTTTAAAAAVERVAVEVDEDGAYAVPYDTPDLTVAAAAPSSPVTAEYVDDYDANNNNDDDDDNNNNNNEEPDHRSNSDYLAAAVSSPPQPDYTEPNAMMMMMESLSSSSSLPVPFDNDADADEFRQPPAQRLRIGRAVRAGECAVAYTLLDHIEENMQGEWDRPHGNTGSYNRLDGQRIVVSNDIGRRLSEQLSEVVHAFFELERLRPS